MKTFLQSTLAKKVKKRLDPIDQNPSFNTILLTNGLYVTSHIYSKPRMIQREKLRLHTSSRHKETAISHMLQI